MRTRQEQILSSMCHLLNAVPLWGLLFCGWFWFSMREESRLVVRQAQQAIMFHILLMGGLLVWMLLGWLSRLIGVLSPDLGQIFDMLNWLIIRLLLLGYVTVCLLGFARCLSGQSFRYPLVSRRHE